MTETQPPPAPPPFPYAGKRTPNPPPVRGGPPGWGPFVTAATGTGFAGVLLVVVKAGWVPMTSTSVPVSGNVITVSVPAFTAVELIVP